MSYQAIQHLAHDQFGFIVRDDASGRCLGGVGANYYRPWVFPLYTPRGLTVLQEFPFDHPFHNGLWVAQGPVQFEGRTVHFWPMPPERRPGESLFQHMGHMETQPAPTVTPHDHGVRFTLQATWRAGDGTPVLEETRTIHLYAYAGADGAEATVCDVVSDKLAAYGALEYSATKFGAICVRVDPRLIPVTGGEVLADGGRRGRADVAFEQANRFVAYESAAGGERFGLLLGVPGEAATDWFVRDYGATCYNPAYARPITVAEAETWRVGLRVVAFDGPLDERRAMTWLDRALL